MRNKLWLMIYSELCIKLCMYPASMVLGNGGLFTVESVRHWRTRDLGQEVKVVSLLRNPTGCSHCSGLAPPLSRLLASYLPTSSYFYSFPTYTIPDAGIGLYNYTRPNSPHHPHLAPFKAIAPPYRMLLCNGTHIKLRITPPMWWLCSTKPYFAMIGPPSPHPISSTLFRI